MTLPAVPEVQELDERLYLLDLGFQGVAGVVGAYLLVDAAGKDLTLIDPGPASSIATLIQRIHQTGYDPAAIRHVLLTHVHLDHAGAAGALLPHFGSARVMVHPRGARHLIDPSKLLASAGRIYGADMDRLWGQTLPVPEHHVDILEDSAEIEVSGRRVQAHHTPGHASHHIAYLDSGARVVFTGDVGGVRIRNIPFVAAPTPPPDIDLPAWRESLNRLRGLRPRRLYLAHYGVVDDPTWHFDALDVRLEDTETWLRGRLSTVTDSSALGAELRDRIREECAGIPGVTAEMVSEAFELAAPSWMNVDGLKRYLAIRDTPRPSLGATQASPVSGE